MMIPAGYEIRPAREEDVEHITDVELAASELFRGMPIESAVFADATPSGELDAACEAGLLLVATAPDGAVVGFAVAEPVDDNLHLEELDVHPEHGRRGLGSALVRAVCDGARAGGFPAVTLTTFRDVPWNAPFYRRLGFEEMPADEVGEDLAEIVRTEDDAGLRAVDRVVMRFRLDD